ncbi:hypothetical protein ACFFHJ_21635 [Planotetraspora thailandica]|nr:hypothetical protein [Planotetraspora thailandica]
MFPNFCMITIREAAGPDRFGELLYDHANKGALAGGYFRELLHDHG